MSGPSKRTLDLVWARDDACCFLCKVTLWRGQGSYSVHHRRARGMGGSKDPVTNSPANLLLLCGSGTSGCHGRIEKHRSWALESGLLVRQGHDPREVEVLVGGRPWPLRLDDEGRIGHVIAGTAVWRINPLTKSA